MEVKHDRASGIDDVQVVLFRLAVCGWWLAMSAQQNIGITQLTKLMMVNGNESKPTQPFHFTTVVYDVAKALERLSLLQLFFGFTYGACHTEAKPRTRIDFYFHLVRSSKRSISHCFCSSIVR